MQAFAYIFVIFFFKFVATETLSLNVVMGIGAMKCGTTSLAYLLSRHSTVVESNRGKETHFFDEWALNRIATQNGSSVSDALTLKSKHQRDRVVVRYLGERFFGQKWKVAMLKWLDSSWTSTVDLFGDAYSRNLTLERLRDLAAHRWAHLSESERPSPSDLILLDVTPIYLFLGKYVAALLGTKGVCFRVVAQTCDPVRRVRSQAHHMAYKNGDTSLEHVLSLVEADAAQWRQYTEFSAYRDAVLRNASAQYAGTPTSDNFKAIQRSLAPIGRSLFAPQLEEWKTQLIGAECASLLVVDADDLFDTCDTESGSGTCRRISTLRRLCNFTKIDFDVNAEFPHLNANRLQQNDAVAVAVNQSARWERFRSIFEEKSI